MGLKEKKSKEKSSTFSSVSLHLYLLCEKVTCTQELEFRASKQLYCGWNLTLHIDFKNILLYCEHSL